MGDRISFRGESVLILSLFASINIAHSICFSLAVYALFHESEALWAMALSVAVAIIIVSWWVFWRVLYPTAEACFKHIFFGD